MQPATHPHPAIPSVLVPSRPLPRCASCGEDLRAADRQGEYRGTAMHEGCALELRLAEIATELAAIRQIAENAMANALFAN